MKNGPRSLFSFREMKAQTSMRSKNRKMSQKSAKSENAQPFARIDCLSDVADTYPA